MGITRITDRLEGVRQSAENRFLARCPAHKDKSPSLSLQERDDGRILMHCFAGCDTEDVLSAIGLNFSDLFDKPLTHWLPPLRTTLSARELWEVTAHEVDVVWILLEQLTPDRSTFSPVGLERLGLACERIADARRHVG